jgi:signal peptidase I
MPRRQIAVAAAGLCMPGLGHLVLGDWVRAAAFLLAVALPIPVAARLAIAVPPRGLVWIVVLGAATSLGAYAWSVVDGVRRARSAEVRLGIRVRPLLYALYLIFGYRLVLAPFAAEARDRWVETFAIAGGSMAPALQPGDRIVVDKSVGRPGGTQLFRGAPVVFIYPNDRRLTFIKRVIGLPGDRVDIDGTSLRVNGREISGPSGLEHGEHGDYTVLWPHDAGATPPLSFVVPNGQVFVLGDNRTGAVDSRRFGAIPLADVKGIARQIWLSASTAGGVRLSRVGQVVQ